MNRFLPGNRITLLSNGDQYFPALIGAIDAARETVWFETYIFADDATGRLVAGALIRVAQRGVNVRTLVDGWGAKFYLTVALEREVRDGGVDFRVPPEAHPGNSAHIACAACIGNYAWSTGIARRRHQRHRRRKHATANPPGSFAVSVEGPLLPEIEQTMQRVWGIVQLVRTGTSELPLLFPEPRSAPRVGTQTARFVIRDNLRHRRDIERAYLAAIRTAKREIILANSYFFPGIRIRRALVSAAQRGVAVTLLLPGRVEYLLLHLATRAMYGQLLQAGITIEEYHRSMLHAKVAVLDDIWATVGSSNIDPYSLLMAREANVIVRDRGFNEKLKGQLRELIATGSRRVVPDDWHSRSRPYKAAIWIAYGIVRMAMGLVGYGGNDWFTESAKD
jgi:cardiolipin synthase